MPTQLPAWQVASTVQGSATGHEVGPCGLAPRLHTGAPPFRQQLQGWTKLQPSHGMHLSTPAVIVTLWVGGAVAGAAGVILAIPVAGCLSVSLRHWREYRDIERLVRAAARK